MGSNYVLMTQLQFGMLSLELVIFIVPVGPCTSLFCSLTIGHNWCLGPVPLQGTRK